MDPGAKLGALIRDANMRLSTAEADPQTKPGAPAAAPAAGEQKNGKMPVFRVKLTGIHEKGRKNG